MDVTNYDCFTYEFESYLWYYQLFFFHTTGCLNGLSIGMTQNVLYYRYV